MQPCKAINNHLKAFLEQTTFTFNRGFEITLLQVILGPSKSCSSLPKNAYQRVNQHICEWINKQMNEWMNEWMNEQIIIWMNNCMNEWISEVMN